MSTPAPGFASHSPRAFNQIANISSLVFLTLLVLYAWLDPPGFRAGVATDYQGGGWAEHFTVIVLIPGILAGAYAYWRYRDRLPSRVLGYWLLAWVLACIFFAGEESSWGQWYFRWKTPEAFADLNVQRETNLHNLSPLLLNRLPKMLVQLFIVVAGFLIPLYRALANEKPIIRRGLPAEWEGWIYAPVACLSAGFLYVVVRIAGAWPNLFVENLGNSELKELCMAWFLMWYLISFLVRLARNGESPQRVTQF